MAGNVVPYLADGTLPRVLDRLAAHLAPGGYLVAGFGLGDALPDKAAVRSTCASTTGWRRPRGCRSSRGTPTWDEQRFVPGGPYAVSVHRSLGG